MSPSYILLGSGLIELFYFAGILALAGAVSALLAILLFNLWIILSSG